MSSPKIFSLQDRSLKLDTAADIEPHLANVDPTIIEEIHLGGNTIGVEASEALAKFLEKTQVLKVANFADIFTGRLISEIPLSLSSICNSLKSKTSLVELNLSDNAFGGRSVDPIVPFLTHNRSFQILKLNNNGLGPAGGIVIANALQESAILSKADGKPSNLRVVICGRNRLENGSAQAWADAFAAHGTLEEVCMPQNGIRMEGITALSHGLKKNPRLRHIDLQDNTFTADGKVTGVQAWADTLHFWPELRILNLSDCVLSAEGEVPTLLEVLAKGSNPELHNLQLQNNNLETATIKLFAKHVGSNMGKLTRLELQWNDVEEDDEHLENLGIALKARGGKLYVNDEEEEEEEEEQEQEQEQEQEEAPKEGTGVEGPKEDFKKVPTAVDKATDDLADLLAKVSVK